MQNGCLGGPKDLPCLCSKIDAIQVSALPCAQTCQGADIAALLPQVRGPVIVLLVVERDFEQVALVKELHCCKCYEKL